jgi:hypothetical protein
MTTVLRRWSFVLVGLVLASILAIASLADGDSPIRVAIGFAIVLGYAVVLAVLQGRSATASVLTGHPVDEWWTTINGRALAMSGIVGAVAALGGFIVAEVTGGDASGYALVAALIGFAYLGTIIWYRLRG